MTSQFQANGRQPHISRQVEENITFLGKWKTTSLFKEMEDDLTCLANGRQPHNLRQMVDDITFLGKRKMTSHFQANGRQPQSFLNGRLPQFIQTGRQTRF